jgi:hypothetical protein
MILPDVPAIMAGRADIIGMIAATIMPGLEYYINTFKFRVWRTPGYKQ